MYWETVSNDTFRICHLVQRFRDLVELPESMTVYTPDNCYVVSKINVAVSFDVGHGPAAPRVA